MGDPSRCTRSTCREPCLRAIDDALARGDRRMISFLNGLEVYRPGEAELVPFDPGLHSFFNVNTARKIWPPPGDGRAGRDSALNPERERWPVV